MSKPRYIYIVRSKENLTVWGLFYDRENAVAEQEKLTKNWHGQPEFIVTQFVVSD